MLLCFEVFIMDTLQCLRLVAVCRFIRVLNCGYCVYFDVNTFFCLEFWYFYDGVKGNLQYVLYNVCLFFTSAVTSMSSLLLCLLFPE